MAGNLISGKKQVILIFAALFSVGILTYYSSFKNEFVWDDNHFFYQNIFTQSLSHILEIFSSNTTAGAGATSNYYRPLTTFSFALDHQIWGWNPIGFHLANTIIHIFNAFLIYLLLAKLGLRRKISLVLAIIFLVHPIQTEAVTYLSSRGDILYTFLLLLSLYLFTKALDSKKKTLMLLISLLLFPLSILSKEGAITTVPIYAIILVLFSFSHKITIPKLYRKYKSHFLLVVLIFWITLVYFLLRLTVLNFNNSLDYGGLEYSSYGSHLSVRLLTFIKTIIIYIQLILIPYPLYLERSTTLSTSVFDPYVLSSISVLLLTIIFGIYEIKKRKTVWIFFSLVLIFSNLLSVSGLIPQTALIRENWLYMPIVGFYLIVITILSFLFSRFIKSHCFLFMSIFIVLSVTYIAITIHQNYNWRNSIVFFEHNLKFTQTARLHLNLGNAYMGKNDYRAAAYHLQSAIQMEDVYPQSHYNLGNLYLKVGKTDEAKNEFLKSIQLDPNYLYSYSPLIRIYEKEGNFSQSVILLKRLNIIYPNDLSLTLLYAQDLYQNGETSEAEIQFQKALQIANNDPKLIQAINQTREVLTKK